MIRVSVREARERFAELLDAAARGEEVVIERREVPTARLVGIGRVALQSRADFRESLGAGPARTASPELVRSMRDEEST
ncbi:MAG: type II toxin-antitoxin system prevent-host-death family antitoxin [Deltaproteobacteria bacterium]|nr:type II toxin-antitoxin system prevent-host-death family antitoxin [Deltaproteobacteria bacterium]